MPAALNREASVICEGHVIRKIVGFAGEPKSLQRATFRPQICGAVDYLSLGASAEAVYASLEIQPVPKFSMLPHTHTEIWYHMAGCSG